ncbi:YaaR family protein [Tepidibacillus infernus]|uniref:YaaR family protein n=1 Tax=Tepidibacillus infernus TaxID=1806172 RepID=UPI003B6C3646
MKIDKGIQKSTTYRASNRLNVDAQAMQQSFSDLMHSQNKQYSKEMLTKLLVEIDETGKKIALSRNLKDIKAYKQLIKRFMDEIIHSAIHLDEQLSYDYHGRSRRYKIIREIDKKLLELTKIALDKEEKQIDILDKIGDIKGLLINLYY